MAKKPVIRYKPTDYLRGGTKVGDKYTAYSNYNQGRPDFGKGAGPGEPYHEVEKTVRRPVKPQRPGSSVPGIIKGNPIWGPQDPTRPSSDKPGASHFARRNLKDARRDAIRRRLGWM